MLAYVISKPGCTTGELLEIPKPDPSPGEALVRILRAGICNTDLEILKGYMGFTGVLGHEFVGIVESVHDATANKTWVGKRVCGDINIGCTACNVCNNTDGLDEKCIKMSRNHCPNRTVLGILNKHGTMAEYITLPLKNLHIVPDGVSDEEAAFAEPLAAACRIVEQKLVDPVKDKVAILGDGKLGLMIAEVIGREYLSARDSAASDFTSEEKEVGTPPILFGKHMNKMNLVADSGVLVQNVSQCQTDGIIAPEHRGQYDVVVDATGSPSGLSLASGLCRPMGTLVLKSTCAAGETFNAAPFVIDELKVVGSRCGPIEKALDMLSYAESDVAAMKPLNVKKYVTKTFPLSSVQEAIQCAAEKDTMKVQIVCSAD